MCQYTLTEGYVHAPVGRYKRLITGRNPWRINTLSREMDSKLFNHMWHLRQPQLVVDKYAYRNQYTKT
jgi:hypothetical protein